MDKYLYKERMQKSSQFINNIFVPTRSKIFHEKTPWLLPWRQKASSCQNLKNTTTKWK